MKGTSTNIKLILTISGMLFGAFLCSHSAYAASYINVSSGPGGTVSFGSIKPTSAGTSATASDTLTVHTDCSVGYSVYVSGQNGKDTNLTNKTAEGDNIISTSSNAIGSAGSLSSNTWGLNHENTGSYVGLPTYDDALTTALTTKSNVEESSTVDIYYGLKVNTALTPGTYTGDVLYTVIMDSSCQAYTVIFNSNGGTGTMNNQSIMAGTKTALDENTFTRDGYTFLGWSTKATGKTGTATDGIGTEADVDYADKAEVTDLTSGGSSVTLYAIWEQSFDTTTMQGWSQGDGCANLSASQQITLTDSRDNHSYTVKKLPDGKCWMVQNLALGMDATETGLTLTPANTNIDNGKTYYLPPAGKQGAGAIGDPSTLEAISTANFENNSAISQHAKTQFRAKGASYSSTAEGYANDSDTGYYDFYTATLGFSYWGDGKETNSSTRDICPRGWRLPWSSDIGAVRLGTAEFYDLALSYNNDSSVWKNYISPDNGIGSDSPYTNNTEVRNGIISGTASSDNSYAGFSHGRYYSGTGLYSGLYAFYWSSSVMSSNYGYSLRVDSSSIRVQSEASKGRGLAVRCLAQTPYKLTINYDANDPDSGSLDKTTDVITLDGQSVVMPSQNDMTKSDYVLLGWALTDDATTELYAPGRTVSVLDIIAAANRSGRTVDSGSSITLYAVWSYYPLALINGNSGAIATSLKNTATGEVITSGDPVPEGTNVTATCTPKAGYYCTGFVSSNTALLPSQTGNTAVGDYTYSFVMPAGAITLTAKGTGNTFTIVYNSNGGTGTTSSTTVTYGSNAKLAEDTFTAPSGKIFKAWGTNASGTTTYEAGASVAPATIKPDVTTTQGGTVTLYAIWEAITDDGNKGNFQTSNICSSIGAGHTATLKDTRDNQTYTVYRFRNTGTAGEAYPVAMSGYCIMTQDLSLGYITGETITKNGNLNLTTSTSSFDTSGSNSSYETITLSGTQTVAYHASSSDWNTTDSYTNMQYTNGPKSGSEAYSSHSYYSYGAALVVCPKGWRLPTDAEGSSIAAFMGGNNPVGSAKIRRAPYNFVYGGYFLSGSWGNVGINGLYWLSTQFSSTSGQGLAVSADILNATSSNAKNRGRSVRCVAK